MAKLLVKKGGNAISITATMADIALLLLVFFMTTTSMSNQKLAKIDLPFGNADSIDQNHIYVGIDQYQKIYLNNEEISLDELRDFLSNGANTLDKKIVIMGDRNLPFGKLSDLLNVTKSLDLLDIVFIVKTME